MKTLAGLMIGILVGGGASYLLVLEDPGGEPRNGSSLASSSSRSDVSRRPEPSSRGDGETEEAEWTANAASFQAHLRAALAAAPRIGRDLGEGRIHGRIVGPSGAPIPNVSIHAKPWKAPEFVVADGEVGVLEEALFAKRWRRANARTTMTDAQGYYTFESLPDVKWTLEARTDEWFIEDPLRYRFSPDSELDFTGHPIARVPVTIVTASGDIPEKATISTLQRSSLSRTGGSDWWTWSREDPILEVPPGRYRFSVVSGMELEAYVSESVSAQVQAGNDNAEVRLRARRVLGIEVAVVLPDGCMLRTHEIRVRAIPLDKDVDGDQEQRLLRSARHPFGPSGGPSVFYGLAPGRWLVGIEVDDEILTTEEVELRDAAASIDMNLPAPPDNEVIEVHARTRRGEPVPDLRFKGTFEDRAGRSWKGDLNTFSYQEGRYRLLRPALPDRLGEEITLTLHTSAESLGNGSATSSYPPPRPLEIEWDQWAALTLHVPGAGRHRYAESLGVRVRHESGRDRTLSSRLTSLDKNDRVAFDGARVGLVEVSVYGWSTGRVKGRWSLEIGRWRIVPGGNEISISLPSLGSLTLDGQPTEEPRLERLKLIGKAQTSEGQVPFRLAFNETNPDRDGRVRLEPIPHGTYTLFGARHSERVAVNGSVAMDWPMARGGAQPNALRAVLTDPSGGLARSGLEDGDLVVAIDGIEIAGNTHFLKSLDDILQEGHAPRVTIVRDGRERELELSRAAGEGPGAGLGGEFWPTTR